MKHKTALITGAASGIGLALTRKLAASGHTVYMVDRSPALPEVAQALRAAGATVHFSSVDVGKEAEVASSAQDALQTMGSCEILVNCAGITPKGNGGPIPLEELTVDNWEYTHRINLVAPILYCQQLIPRMAEAGYGRVVNIASRSGRMHVEAAGLDYHASKAGLIGVTRALAGIYAAKGVTVNCVAPGRIDTPLSKQTRPEILELARQGIPARRFGQPEEVADAIEFLVSASASYITGSCIDVNGGGYMN